MKRKIFIYSNGNLKSESGVAYPVAASNPYWVENKAYDRGDFEVKLENIDPPFTTPSILDSLGKQYVAYPPAPAEHIEQVGEWQLCPKCFGTGQLQPPYEVRGTAIVMGICDVCNGTKIIARPVAPSSPVSSDAEKRLEEILGNDDPYPLLNVLQRLNKATKYLLQKKDYDGIDHEEIRISTIRAEEIIRILNTKK